MGLLPPTSGKILVDGKVRSEREMQLFRSSCSYVQQEVFLVDSSIAENIAFGVPPEEIDRELLDKSAKAACLHDFVQNELADGYATMVGEQGVRLSGGQRQRISIARALYRKPKFLILDEATSALDQETEKRVLDEILRFEAGLTIVSVSHRLNMLKSCDKILVIDGGRAADCGRPSTLLKSSEIFQSLAAQKDQ